MRQWLVPFVVAFGVGLGVGCQVYDFEPVTPITLSQTTQTKDITARPLKPNLFLLVDRSGSMNRPVDPSADGGRTRIQDLRAAMLGGDGTTYTDAGFLGGSATLVRMGLAFFPGDAGTASGLVDQCRGTTDVAVGLPPPTARGEPDTEDTVLLATTAAIAERIRDVTPGGGTPVTDSLTLVGALPGLTDDRDQRDDFIVLLTDGLPNCNAANVNQQCACNEAVCGSCASPAAVCAAQVTACRCTEVDCSLGQLCSFGCLDQVGAVDQIRTLRTRAGIRTIVVGFGADTGTGPGPEVLAAMAEAGGFVRECAGADCGPGNRCIDGRCERQFFQAANGDELRAALEDITASFEQDPCRIQLLEFPSSPELLSVLVDGERVGPGPTTWLYDPAGQVVFVDGQPLCERIKVSTPQDPVAVEVRIVEVL